jgi:hypothetical protein
MFIKILLLVYRLYFFGWRGNNWVDRYLLIERCVGFDDKIPLTPDEKMNEPYVYAEMFSEKYRQSFEQLYLMLISSMRWKTYDQCVETIEALDFLQAVSARGLWKFNQDVGDLLESFVREFDRLDVPSERVRLYESAQKH